MAAKLQNFTFTYHALGIVYYLWTVNFEDYLAAKKIDSRSFRAGDKDVFEQWQSEFELMHPNSFTVQKLNLINPIRRKYPLQSGTTTGAELPKVQRPVIPKPKIN